MTNQNIERTRRSVARKLNPETISTSTLRSLLGYLVGMSIGRNRAHH